MRTLRAASVGMFLLSVSLVLAQDNDAVKKDKALLKGTWKIDAFETSQGKKDDLQDATLTFEGDKIAFKKGDDTKKGSYSINPAGKPKEIDLKAEDKEEAVLGIYKVDKDTLTLCIAGGPMAVRPTEFEAKDKSVLITLKRVKE